MSSEVEVPLGSIIFISKSSGFKVESAATAYLGSQDSGPDATTCHHKFTPSSAWITKPHRLVLEIECTWQGTPLDRLPPGPSRLNSLRQAISEAEIWQRWGLIVVAADILPTGGNINSLLVLNIGEDTGVPSHGRRCFHRLATGIDTIKPPVGISRYNLKTVHVNVDLQPVACNPSSSRRANRAHDRQSLLHSSSAPELGGSLSKASLVTGQDNPSVGLSDVESLPVEDLCGLVRNAVLSSIERKLPGIKSKTTLQDWRDQTLQELAPAVWDQEYAMAFSQRTCFLPSIRHSVVRLSSRGVLSASLPAKLQLLAEPEVSEDPTGLSESSTDDTASQEQCLARSVNLRLWRISQHIEIHRRRSLKPKHSSPPSGTFDCPGIGFPAEDISDDLFEHFNADDDDGILDEPHLSLDMLSDAIQHDQISDHESLIEFEAESMIHLENDTTPISMLPLFETGTVSLDHEAILLDSGASDRPQSTVKCTNETSQLSAAISDACSNACSDAIVDDGSILDDFDARDLLDAHSSGRSCRRSLSLSDVNLPSDDEPLAEYHQNSHADLTYGGSTLWRSCDQSESLEPREEDDLQHYDEDSSYDVQPCLFYEPCSLQESCLVDGPCLLDEAQENQDLDPQRQSSRFCTSRGVDDQSQEEDGSQGFLDRSRSRQGWLQAEPFAQDATLDKPYNWFTEGVETPQEDNMSIATASDDILMR